MTRCIRTDGELLSGSPAMHALTGILAPLVLFAVLVAKVGAAHSGLLQWTTTDQSTAYHSYSHMVLGARGEIFVGGSRMPSQDNYAKSDFLAARINPIGGTDWIKVFDGPAQQTDFITQIAVGPSNTVFLVGESMGKGGVATDANSTYDSQILAYSSRGALLWSQRFNGNADGFDGPGAVIVDKVGRLYVAGRIAESRSGNSLLRGYLHSYGVDGSLLWSQRYVPPQEFSATPKFMAQAHNGQLYVLILITRSGNTEVGTVLASYSTTGEPLWTKRFEVTDGYTPPAGLVVNSKNEAYVALTATQPEDGRVACVGPDGELRWTQSFPAQIRSITADSRDRLLVGGVGRDARGFNSTWVMGQISPEGDRMWTHSLAPESYSLIQAMATDTSDNIYVTGIWADSRLGGFRQTHTVAYDSGGAILWTNLLKDESFPSSIAVDTQGRAYVAGQTSFPSGLDGAVIAFSPLLFIEKASETQSVAMDKPAQLRFEVHGARGMTYQWFFENTLVSGATNSTLTIAHAQRVDSGNYELVVSNRFLVVTSAVVKLKVVEPPQLRIDPPELVVTCGSSTSLIVHAEGPGDYTYQWRFHGLPMQGQTNAQLDLQRVTQDQAGDYDVLVGFLEGYGVTSRVVRLQIDTQVIPLIVEHPRGLALVPGARGFLGVTASSCSAARYQWTRNGGDLPGAMQATLSLPPFHTNLVGDYAVRVCNEFGCTTSLTARLDVNRPPVTEKTGITTTRGTALTIPDSLLLSQAYDPDLDPLSVRSVANLSYWGGTVSRNGAETRYDPLPGFFGMDTVGYIITDGRGAHASGTLEVFVVEGLLPSYNSLGIAIVPGGIRIRYWGPAGASGMLQRRDVVGAIHEWQNVLEFKVPAHGVWEHVTPAGASDSFWRSSIP